MLSARISREALSRIDVMANLAYLIRVEADSPIAVRSRATELEEHALALGHLLRSLTCEQDLPHPSCSTHMPALRCLSEFVLRSVVSPETAIRERSIPIRMHTLATQALDERIQAVHMQAGKERKTAQGLDPVLWLAEGQAVQTGFRYSVQDTSSPSSRRWDEIKLPPIGNRQKA